MAWYPKSKSFGIYEPKPQFGDSLAMSSHERVKQHILDRQYEMEKALEEMMMYQMHGTTQALKLEEVHSKILLFFMTVRPHITNYFHRQEISMRKMKNAEERKQRQSIIDAQQAQYHVLSESFIAFYNKQTYTKECFLSTTTFLIQFVYDLGISKIELPERDPLKDYSIAAYGEDLTEEAGVYKDATSTQSALD